MNYTDNNFTQTPRQQNNKNDDSKLIIILSILASVVVIAIVFIILLVCDVISFGGDNKAVKPPTDIVQQDAVVTSSNEVVSTPSPEPDPIPVQRSMFVDCNVELTLRSGPATSHSKICTIPTGSSVYVIEFTNDEFAKVTYNGYDGYLMRSYLSDTKPFVWNYDADSVENFVASSVRFYVNAINTGDTDFVYGYYSNSLAQSELASIQSNSKVAMSEELLSINCHSVQRISKTAVTVIRESTIRVNYYDGTTKDVVEKFKYTVEANQQEMFITALERM